MLFMNTWRAHAGKIHDTYKAFAEMPSGDGVGDGGSQINIIGRWHNMASGSGVVVYETDDPKAMAQWALNWNEVLELTIEPVVDDETAKAIGREKWG